MSPLLTIIFAVSCLVAVTSGIGEPEVEFSYNEQEIWPGICVENNSGKQSPINIQTSSLKPEEELIELEFGSGWRAGVDGTFGNTGHNVQFNPTDTASPNVTTLTHRGLYRVQQMHMHWGRNDDEGSEHTVDGQRYSLEIHFVHIKVGETDRMAGDYLDVISVLAEADPTMEVSGVWAKLNDSMLQPLGSNISVTGLVYSDLLPDSTEYYHYVGSLTTPGCDEIVQWFVMRNTIRVPSAFLRYLRRVESANENEILTFNFREEQPIGQRTVYIVGSGAAPISVVSLAMIAFMLLLAYLV